MSEHVAAVQPPKPENFDLDAMGKGWSQKLKSTDLETKGRGRPSTSGKSSRTTSAPSPESSALEFSGKELAPLVRAVGNPLCRTGGVQVLEDSEVTELSDALAPLLSKYFGESINRWGVEVAFVGVALKVGAPRVIQAMDNRKAKADEPEAATAEGEGIKSKLSKSF